jgi:predicted nucleic acid-binding protein
MIVFDAGVLIALANADDTFHRKAVGFVERHEEAEFAASVVNLSESLVRPAMADRGGELWDLFERFGIIPIDLVGTDVLGVATVRAATRLRMPDAIVVYTAEKHRAELVTTDHTVARAAAARDIIVHDLGAIPGD